MANLEKTTIDDLFYNQEPIIILDYCKRTSLTFCILPTLKNAPLADQMYPSRNFTKTIQEVSSKKHASFLDNILIIEVCGFQKSLSSVRKGRESLAIENGSQLNVSPLFKVQDLSLVFHLSGSNVFQEPFRIFYADLCTSKKVLNLKP